MLILSVIERASGKNSLVTLTANGGLHMNSEQTNYLGQETPQWMREMFQELSDMFEELLPDTDRLNLKEMQQRLDELEQSLLEPPASKAR